MGTEKNGKPKIVSEIRSVKTLSLLAQEETIRNNKVMEHLQEQANKIAASAASASWASVRAQRTLGTITQLQDIMTKGTLVPGTDDTYDYGDGYRYQITSSKTFKNLGKTPK